MLKQNLAGSENWKNRAAYTREGRKQLFAVLQSARGSSGDSGSYSIQLPFNNLFYWANFKVLYSFCFEGKTLFPGIIRNPSWSPSSSTNARASPKRVSCWLIYLLTAHCMYFYNILLSFFFNMDTLFECSLFYQGWPSVKSHIQRTQYY